MRVSNVLAVVLVADFETSRAWYARLLGRAPDRVPMDGCAEWQLTRDGGLQVVRDGAKAGSCHATFGVEDLELQVAFLEKAGLVAGPIETGHMSTGETIRIARLRDPDGNTIIFGEEPETRPG
ncbi:VOC family protein [Luteolibacter sp. LG18]|uniref:VOC family protein n=1 Tax=Luteolibacter sp. LG18 TaxID=2819286 RepID=UPI002B287EFC|nr:glyoxalase [Luteolibacter sp. LG18]